MFEVIGLHNTKLIFKYAEQSKLSATIKSSTTDANLLFTREKCPLATIAGPA